MEVKKSRTILLRNEEHFQFETDFKNLVERFTPATLTVETLYAAFLLEYNKESEAINVIRKSDQTELLETRDYKRDQSYNGMRKDVLAKLLHFNKEVVAAAARLAIVFDQYGDVANKPYNEETASITKLHNELSTTYAADMETVKCADWLPVLNADNIAFSTGMSQRFSSESGKTELKMKEIRKKVDAAYNKVVKRLNALIEVNGETNYTEFVKELNQRIQYYNNVLAIRQGRNNNDNNNDTHGETDPS